jgi:hypothetical protein
MRRCANPKCKKDLPVAQFSKRKITKRCKDGLAKYCKACDEMQHRFTQSIKSAMMRLFFSARNCADCKESDPVLLECDHVNDDKLTAASGRSIAHLPVSQMAAEMAKCAVVCIFCHHLRTWKTRGSRVAANEGVEWSRQERLRAGSCKICERKVVSENVAAFHFDHLDPEKKLNGVLQLVRHVDKMKEEAAKCQIICAHCHRRKTAADAGWRKLEDFDPEVVAIARQNLSKVFPEFKQ